MTKPNIVFFTGSNRVFLHRDLDKWIEVFATKYGEYNISRLDRSSVTPANVTAELTTPVFLGEKRLVVLSWIPFAAASGEEKSGNESEVESTILQAMGFIPDSTVVVFVESEPDKRKSLYKELHSIATVKDYPVLEWGDLRDYVRRRLPHIDVSAAALLIEACAADMDRLESEIEKLSLFRQNDWITEADIREHIVPHIEASVFVLTDAILDLDVKKAYRELDRILETSNIHQIFTTVLSTLRSFCYLTKLLSLRYDAEAIKSALKMHPFVFDKMRKRLGAQHRMYELLGELVVLDRRTKTGEWIGDTDDALRLGLEKAILRLQKA